MGQNGVADGHDVAVDTHLRGWPSGDEDRRLSLDDEIEEVVDQDALMHGFDSGGHELILMALAGDADEFLQRLVAVAVRRW